MKKIFSLLALSFSLSVSAQMKTFFFGQPWSEVPALTDSIKKALPGYELASEQMTKSGKTKIITFVSKASGASLELQILRFVDQGERIGMVQLRGQKEAVWPFYEQCFDTPSMANFASVIVKATPAGQNLPIACNPDRDGKWLLSVKNPI